MLSLSASAGHLSPLTPQPTVHQNQTKNSSGQSNQDQREAQGLTAGEVTSKESKSIRVNETTTFSSVENLTSEEKAIVNELSKIDREVKAHEMAHKAAGAGLTGPASYSYQRGPNGRLYAVEGSVEIDVSPVPNDPRATLEKAQQIQQAALAPSQPSNADRQVAAAASAMAAEARAELASINIPVTQQGLSTLDKSDPNSEEGLDQIQNERSSAISNNQNILQQLLQSGALTGTEQGSQIDLRA
ncbi:MAG: hypothetical protein ACI845_004023 [Gammaproteobacteria bacterium]